MINKLCNRCGYSTPQANTENCKWCNRFQSNPNWGQSRRVNEQNGTGSDKNSLKVRKTGKATIRVKTAGSGSRGQR